jgi:hypothetical protein
MNSPVERSANIWANRREQHPVLGIVYVFTPPALAMFVDSLPKPEPEQEPVSCVACEGHPQGDNIPCAVCEATSPAAHPTVPSQYGSAELSDQKINDLVVEYATAIDQLAELGRYVDYDPDVGRVPEHWVADPLVVAAVKYVLAALVNK